MDFTETKSCIDRRTTKSPRPNQSIGSHHLAASWLPDLVILGQFGWTRVNYAGRAQALKNITRIGIVNERLRRFWKSRKDFKDLECLECFGMFRNVLECVGMFWNVLEYHTLSLLYRT